MLSVALQGLRGRKAPFIGAFVALAVASALVMACGMLLQAGLTSKAPVERYAAAPVVVAGDQNAHVNVGTDNEDTVPLLERARVDASIVPALSRVPGVAHAIPDISVPVDVLGPHGAVAGPGGHPVALHPWRTAALTPYSLERGRAPVRAGEMVVDAGLAARGHLTVGQKIRLSSTAPVQRAVVVGIVRTSVAIERQGVVFTTSAAAERLSGLRGRVDAVAILPGAGVDQKALVKNVGAVLRGRARVVTGSARGDVEHIENIEAREGVTAIGGTFGGLSLFIAMFVVASTIGLSVLQREREVALLRAVAATPKQVRRMIRWETLVVALVASVAGALPGALFAGALGGVLSDRGIAPEDMHVGFALIPFAVAVASSVLTALVAVAAAGRRAARVRPTVALQESGGSTRLISPLRAAAGLAALGGAVALLAVSAGSDDPSSAADMAAGTSFALVIAAAVLGPIVIRVASGIGAKVLARGKGNVNAFLAVSNMRASSRRFASAMTPLVLTVAVSSTLLFSGTIRQHAASQQEKKRVIADLVVQSDTLGLPPSAVAEVRATPGVASAVGLGQTNLGPGLGSKYSPIQAAVLDPRGLTRVLDLHVRSGSLADMRDDTIAVSEAQARMGHVSVGETVPFMLGDGARRRAKIVAVYDRSLGLGDVILSPAIVRGHATSSLLESILVRTGDGASPAAVDARLTALWRRYPGLTVGGPDAHAARADKTRETDNWLLRILAGIIFVFTAVAVVNTLVMIALHRRRELGLLQLVGGTRRQVIGMARWEGALTVALGLGIGAVIALITLVPTSALLSGSSVPYLPPALVALVLGSAAAVGLVATQVSTRVALRPRPVDAIGASD